MHVNFKITIIANPTKDVAEVIIRSYKIITPVLYSPKVLQNNQPHS